MVIQSKQRTTQTLDNENYKFKLQISNQYYSMLLLAYVTFL